MELDPLKAENKEQARLLGISGSKELSLMTQLTNERKVNELLQNYLTHTDQCILSFFEAGRPTENGGYEQKIKGHWYQTRPIDETPPCDCGLDEALETWRQVTKNTTNVAI